MNNELATALPELKTKVYRFDVFKGVLDSTGKIHRLRSVGSASLIDGCKTYTVRLKTLLDDQFYILPETRGKSECDYIVLTREFSKNPGRKFFWNSVGEGNLLDGENAGFLHLKWDIFGADDIYLNLHPKNSDGE